jgi:threonine/homoserine/homoserine lactone efflux protein
MRDFLCRIIKAFGFQAFIQKPNLPDHMIPVIVHLVFGALVSFIGSLPMGLINLTVAETAVSRGMRAALLLALGAVIVEFGQILVALFFADWFTSDPAREFWISLVGSVVFIAAGLFYLLQKPGKPALNTDQEFRKGNPFFHGLGLSAVNMLAIPFWLMTGAYSSAQGWLGKEALLLVCFALGAVLGTYGLFYLYARLGLFILRRSKIISKYAGKGIGVIFILLGSWQIIKLLIQ